MSTEKTWNYQGADLNVVKKVRDRLYSERRIHGDEMRDMAQALDAFIELERHLQFDEHAAVDQVHADLQRKGKTVW